MKASSTIWTTRLPRRGVSRYVTLDGYALAISVLLHGARLSPPVLGRLFRGKRRICRFLVLVLFVSSCTLISSSTGLARVRLAISVPSCLFPFLFGKRGLSLGPFFLPESSLFGILGAGQYTSVILDHDLVTESQLVGNFVDKLALRKGKKRVKLEIQSFRVWPVFEVYQLLLEARHFLRREFLWLFLPLAGPECPLLSVSFLAKKLAVGIFDDVDIASVLIVLECFVGQSEVLSCFMSSTSLKACQVGGKYKLCAFAVVPLHEIFEIICVLRDVRHI
mmetsp:Transcript_390/g.1315  ORF Transcript_390/g.1315 Transcript_390/m.1315 type:complete len:278 (+) Transcript_390:2890-3723(+)